MSMCNGAKRVNLIINAIGSANMVGMVSCVATGALLSLFERPQSVANDFHSGHSANTRRCTDNRFSNGTVVEEKPKIL